MTPHRPQSRSCGPLAGMVRQGPHARGARATGEGCLPGSGPHHGLLSTDPLALLPQDPLAQRWASGLLPSPRYNGFFPWPQPKAMTQDNSTGRAGLLPPGRFVTMGTGLRPARNGEGRIGKQDRSLPRPRWVPPLPPRPARCRLGRHTEAGAFSNSRSLLLMGSGGRQA